MHRKLTGNIAGTGLTTLENLEARLTALEDREALQKLKARYAQLCDEKYVGGALRPQHELDGVARRIADLFTADAVWDGGPRFGTSCGAEQIYERFCQATFSYAMHFFVLPDIIVDGDTAGARWYLLEAATLRDGTAIWIGGFEDDEYLRQGGTWRISRMKVDLEFMTPYDQGWARKNLIV